MPKTRFITATCTPLHNDETLHDEGLEAHIEDQWKNGVYGLLVAGTMGRLQLLSDQTYKDLVRQSVEFARGKGEILVGVGDASFVRTRDRIQCVEGFDIDGVVALAPYFVAFTQEELVDYYTALADVSSKPLYLYDLPQVTGTKLAVDTVLRIADHPNVAGIKCSDDYAHTRPLIDALGDRFRIIVAQPFLVDTLIRDGVQEHLDGIYGVAPRWTVSIAEAAEAGDWDAAAKWQGKLSDLLRTLRDHYPVIPACSEILNKRGIPGQVFMAPQRPLSQDQHDRLFNEPIIKQLLKEDSGGSSQNEA